MGMIVRWHYADALEGSDTDLDTSHSEFVEEHR